MKTLTHPLILFMVLTALINQACTNQTGYGNTTNGQSSADSASARLMPQKLNQIIQYTTAKEGGLRFAENTDLLIGEFKQPDEFFPTIMIDSKKRFQTIEGFGGALTDAAAETFYQLPEAKQQELVAAYFDKEKGLGYNFFRTPIHSCDFSSESYAYAEQEDDKTLESFTIAHDKEYKLPFIKTVQQAVGNEFKLLASPWSPPAWMKSNNHMLQGGHLLPEYYQTWADYFVKFTQAYEQEGIPVWGFTVQNEPMAVQTWESCVYTAEEEKNFVKNYLGPTLERNNLADKKIIIWDHNRGIMYQRAKIAYDDPEAAQYIWGTGFHWYSGDHFNNVRQVQEAFPDKKTIFTEGCVFPFNYNKLAEWHWGERYGESLIHDLNNSATAWIDWNILLNENGGPNHVENYCYAPVIGDTQKGELIYMSSYYYLGHFSKFIRPGARRIIASSNNDNLLTTAFLNPDQSIAVVVMNPTDQQMEFKLWMENQGTLSSLPAHSIATLMINEKK